MAFFNTVAEAQTTDNTVVFGNTKTGKTHYIIEQVLKQSSQDVLWIAFDNLNFEGKALPEWKTAEPDNWETFDKNVLVPMRSKTLRAGIVVFEGVDVASEYFKNERLAKLAQINGKPAANYTQQVYGEIGPKLRETIALLRNSCDALYLSMSTRTKIDIGGSPSTTFPLNVDAISKVLTMCPNLVYTSAKVTREQNGVPSAVNYFVQTNSLSAMSFIQGAKS